MKKILLLAVIILGMSSCKKNEPFGEDNCNCYEINRIANVAHPDYPGVPYVLVAARNNCESDFVNIRMPDSDYELLDIRNHIVCSDLEQYK
tara:strand:- start:3586 stop:3858 length:273 start_codon:yes stop_codon:yes gene_type:complete